MKAQRQGYESPKEQTKNLPMPNEASLSRNLINQSAHTTRVPLVTGLPAQATSLSVMHHDFPKSKQIRCLRVRKFKTLYQMRSACCANALASKASLHSRPLLFDPLRSSVITRPPFSCTSYPSSTSMAMIAGFKTGTSPGLCFPLPVLNGIGRGA